ncbi:MAG: hypothetical protein ACREQ4_00255, partial [Candidatus Binataceae bacterium]
MRRSVLAPIIATAILFVAGCGARQPKKSLPHYAAHTATLGITDGIKVLGLAQLPPGFIPLSAPSWLLNGSGIGLAGLVNGHTVVIGFGGTDLSSRQVIAADFGRAALNGHIVNVAISPGGMTLATAVVEPKRNQLSVVLRDLISKGQGHSIASFGGSYKLADLTWLDRNRLALALTPEPSPPSQPQTSTPPNAAPAAEPTPVTKPGHDGKPPSQSNKDPQAAPAAAVATPAPASGDGLYLIDIRGAININHLDKLACPLSHLSFSPNRLFAAGDGNRNAPPVVLDVRNQACRQFNRNPIR